MIAFVILHYQAIEETINCIDTIRKMVTEEKKIIIVDNCSPNGTGKTLQQQYRNSDTVDVILLNKNLGFAKGNNIGFKEAKKGKPDFIVVMNNDVFIQQYNFSELVKQSYEKYRFSILGPDIYSTKTKGHQNPQRIINYSLEELKRIKKKLEFKLHNKWMLRLKYLFPQFLRFRKKEQNQNLIDHVLENVVLHGACYIFSKNFISKHDNCFYNETFMYFESYILHFLAQKEGLKMVYDPSIIVQHHEDIATDMTYEKQYKKSIFINRCLLDSCNIFLHLYEDNHIMFLS